jgi:hypothetical protein
MDAEATVVEDVAEVAVGGQEMVLFLIYPLGNDQDGFMDLVPAGLLATEVFPQLQ